MRRGGAHCAEWPSRREAYGAQRATWSRAKVRWSAVMVAGGENVGCAARRGGDGGRASVSQVGQGGAQRTAEGEERRTESKVGDDAVSIAMLSPGSGNGGGVRPTARSAGPAWVGLGWNRRRLGAMLAVLAETWSGAWRVHSRGRPCEAHARRAEVRNGPQQQRPWVEVRAAGEVGVG